MGFSSPRAALSEVFGFSEFREGQEKVIDQLQQGHCSLAVFPTGGGKSLCYQVPSLLFPGLTIVVSPLIALMKDQQEAMLKRGIKVARLDSTLTSEETLAVYQSMRRRELKLLYVAPERFVNTSFQNQLQQSEVSLLAIDEAHCISEWGHAFRPEYLKIAQSAAGLGIKLILALTATATPKVARDICNSFGIEPEHHIQTGFQRPNLSLKVTTLDTEEKDTYLLQQIKEAPDDSTIVYVTRQFTTESVATFLKKNGVNARAYHAGLNKEIRDEVQENFMHGEVKVVVATIAFGMGIDKADIRHVYHYNVPKSFENYVQETGRAGRDRAPASCELLASGEDFTVLENFIYARRPSVQSVQSFLQKCLGHSGAFTLNRYELSVAHDMKPEVMQSILVWLELNGILLSKGWRYGTFQVKLLRSLEQILHGHSEKRQQYLRTFFEKAKEGRTYYTFVIADVAEAMGEEEEKIIKTLNWLEGHQDLTLKPSQFLMVYAPTEEGLNSSAKDLAQRVNEHFFEWERREVQRLQMMKDFITQTECLEKTLLRYFGEEVEENCGKCSSCLQPKSKKPTLKYSLKQTIATDELTRIADLHNERHQALRSARQLAKFLCGHTSPATTRARLTRKHDLFAYFEDYPFQEVLETCEGIVN